MLCPKMFESKKFGWKLFFGAQQYFSPKNIGSLKNLGLKQEIFVSKNVGLKIIFGPNKFEYKKFLVQKTFRFNKNTGPKQILDPKNSVSKKVKNRFF